MLQENFPYGHVSRNQQHNQISLQFLYASLRAGDTNLANKVSNSIKKDMEQQKAYYESLSERRRDNLSLEEERNDNLFKGLMGLEAQFKSQQQLLESGPGKVNTRPVTGDSQ